MLGRIAVVVFIIGLIAPVVTAQTIPVYDPSDFPWQPKLRSFEKCGIRLAVDPTWPMELRKERKKDGAIRWKYAFRLDASYWRAKEKTVPYGGFSLEPTVTLSVSCSETPLKHEDAAANIAKSVRDTLNKDRNKSFGKVTYAQVRGIGKIGLYAGQGALRSSGPANGTVSDRGYLYALHRGQLVKLRISISRTPGKVWSKALPKGTVFEGRLRSGERTSVQLGREALLYKRANEIAYKRSQAENLAIINAVFKSLRSM